MSDRNTFRVTETAVVKLSMRAAAVRGQALPSACSEAASAGVETALKLAGGDHRRLLVLDQHDPRHESLSVCTLGVMEKRGRGALRGPPGFTLGRGLALSPTSRPTGATWAGLKRRASRRKLRAGSESGRFGRFPC